MEEMINKMYLELAKNEYKSSYAKGVFDVLCAINTANPDMVSINNHCNKFDYLVEVYDELKSTEEI